MSWQAALLIYALLLAGFLTGGVIIGTAIGLVGVIGVTLVSGTNLWVSFGDIVWNTTTSFTLVSVPLFVLMGEIILRSGISQRFYAGIAAFLGFVPGGLAHTNILGCAVFSALSGSTVATAMTIGTVALPEMRARGYDDSLTLGTLTGGGCLGILIPPSIPMIVYAMVANVSVLDMFVAGIVPGLALMSAFILYVGGRVLIDPGLVPRQERRVGVHELVRGAIDTLPVVGLIAVVLGGMYWGIVTPTEAAGFGCLAAMILASVYRQLTWRAVYGALLNATVTSCVVMFIVINSQLLSFAIVQSGIGRGISTALGESGFGPFAFFCCLVLLYIVVGMFIDGLSIMLLTVPVLYPALDAMGYDPVWLGVVIIVLIELGALTPPMGLNLFAIQSITRETPLGAIGRASLPFALIILAFCFLLYWVPDIVLFLPHLMRGA